MRTLTEREFVSACEYAGIGNVVAVRLWGLLKLLGARIEVPAPPPQPGSGGER